MRAEQPTPSTEDFERAQDVLYRQFCPRCGIGTAHDSEGCVNCHLLDQIKNSGPIPVRLGNGESEEK